MPFLLFLLLLLASCGHSQSSADVQAGDTLRFRHAELLTVVRHADHTDVLVANPWRPGHTLHRYVLVGRDAPVPRHAAADATVLRVPLQRVVAFSTVHASLMVDLDVADALVGVADLSYVHQPLIRRRCSEGTITDVGSSLNPTLERVVGCAAEALLVSPFENSGGYGKLEQSGVALVECADYMERSPLGRAEWVRLYGLLFGCQQEADSLFAATESSYRELKALAATATTRPKALVDKLTGSVWYVPAPQSTIGRMLADANMSLPFDDNQQGGSVPLALETVLNRAADSDLWLLRYSGDRPITLTRLAAEHHGYSLLRPFREQRCYGCNVDEVPFYEQTPFHPDRLLCDFVSIAHPELLPNHTLRYFHPIR